MWTQKCAVQKASVDVNEHNTTVNNVHNTTVNNREVTTVNNRPVTTVNNRQVTTVNKGHINNVLFFPYINCTYLQQHPIP